MRDKIRMLRRLRRNDPLLRCRSGKGPAPWFPVPLGLAVAALGLRFEVTLLAFVGLMVAGAGRHLVLALVDAGPIRPEMCCCTECLQRSWVSQDCFDAHAEAHRPGNDVTTNGSALSGSFLGQVVDRYGHGRIHSGPHDHLFHLPEGGSHRTTTDRTSRLVAEVLDGRTVRCDRYTAETLAELTAFAGPQVCGPVTDEDALVLAWSLARRVGLDDAVSTAMVSVS